MNELKILVSITITFFIVVDISEQKEKTPIVVPYSEIVLFNEIARLEQDVLVQEKMIKEGYQYNTSTFLRRNLASDVINYLLKHENDEEKITELAALMLKPLGAYGSEKEEKILHSQKLSVIHEWLRYSILGMSFHDWILNELNKINLTNVELLKHVDFENRFWSQLFSKSENGTVSQEAMGYYMKNIITEDMPSFTMFTTREETKRLNLMKLNDKEFGYLHVGLKVLKESESENEKVKSLDEIIEIGLFIESLIQEGIVTNSEFFELPAKIYITCNLNVVETPSSETPSTYYEEYFNHMRRSNPFIQLMEPLNNWKTRPDLAKQVLKENDVSEENLYRYLHRGDSSDLPVSNNKNETVTMPAIDNIFEKQNKNVRDSFRELDKLMLFQIFEKMDEQTQKFIQAANISFAKASFHDRTWNSSRIVTAFAIVHDGGINTPAVYLRANDIALLLCETDVQKHVYALNSQTYELTSMDFDEQKYLKLYNVTVSLKDYKLFIEKISEKNLKNEGQPVDVLVDKLSEIHSETLYESLKEVGYKATGWQKLENFLLSLIPFYTCVKELKSEKPEGAILPCSIDFVSFVPLIGQGIRVAYKFGTTLGRVATQAVILAGKQASMYQMLHQFGKHWLTSGLSQVHKTLNSQVLRNLGFEFLSAIDPGIGLLKLGGKAIFETIKKGYGYVKKSFGKLEKIVDKLKEQADKVLRPCNLLSSDVLKTEKVIFLPDIRREATVVKVGTNNGKDVMVRIDLDTGAPFGRKYIHSESDYTELIPIKIDNEIFQLTYFPGQKLATTVARASSKKILTPLKSSERVNEVYIVDKRTPDEIFGGCPLRAKRSPQGLSLKTECVREVYRVGTRTPEEIDTAGGCSPFTCGIYNYNMEKHHEFYRKSSDGVYNNEASPFVSTSASLEKAIHFQKTAGMKHELTKKLIRRQSTSEDEIVENPIIGYILKIRPGSNFYNLPESYKAARDVTPATLQRYYDLDDLYRQFKHSKQYVALKGFDKDRIIETAPLREYDTAETVTEWTPNRLYNKDYDNDVSAEDLYLHVGLNRRDDAKYMAVNLVRQTVGADEKAALKFVAEYHRQPKVWDWVTKYNTNKQEQIHNIRREWSFYQRTINTSLL